MALTIAKIESEKMVDINKHRGESPLNNINFKL